MAPLLRTTPLLFLSTALFAGCDLVGSGECDDDDVPADDDDATDDDDAADDDDAVDPCADAQAGTWSYDAIDCWGAYSAPGACDGEAQSPIDLVGSTPTGELPALTSVPSLTTTHIENLGTTIRFSTQPGSFASYGTTENGLIDDRTLQHIDVHTPSEHTRDGEAEAMELQFHHTTIWSGTPAIVSVFVEEGAESAVLADFISNLPVLGQVYAGDDTFNPYDLLPAVRSYHTYEGSLTTPPCTENVLWIVMDTPITASAEQISAFSDLLGNNARPAQPLNGRTVDYQPAPQ